MPASPRVEIHHDFAVLERRLEDLLRALKREDGPLAPAAVVVPTARLRAHLQERLAERCGTLLQVRFFHHDSFAAEAATDAAAAGARAAPLRPIGEAAREAILSDAAARAGGATARWLTAVPPGAGALLATMDDLREAGIDPAAARRVAGLSDEARALLAVYSEYGAALQRLRAAGFSDRAGRVAAALDHLPRFARRFHLLVHYGAYELVGMNLDLMRAAQASGVPAVWLAPGHPSAPAFAYARSFWREAFGVDPIPLRDDDAPAAAAARGADDRRLLGASLPRLYDEEHAPGEGAEVRFFHAQGCGGELQEAALTALQDHLGTATPACRIGVLARSLEPYAGRLADLAKAHALPLTTSASAPIAIAAAAQAAVRLLRVVLLDVPAPTLIELVRSGCLIPPRGTEPARVVDSWERLVHHYRVAGGLALIGRALTRWVEESPPPPARRPAPGSDGEARRRRALLADAVHLGRLVAALDRESADLRGCRDWSAFAAAARSLLEARLTPFASGAPEEDPGASGVLAALDDLEALHAAGVRFESPAAALQALERGIAAARTPLASLGPDGAARDQDEGGVRVYDVMQGRGLSFDTVILLGLNAGQFPRPARPDPFLGDDDRRRLREALGRPVPMKEASRLEEHLLLALALGSARRRLVVGWQRADEEGRALSPSLALREIARIARGQPDLEEIARTARRVSGDPRQAATDSIREHGLLPPEDALLAAALDAGSPQGLLGRVETLAPLVPGGAADFASGLEFLAAIESPDDRGFDTLVGALRDDARSRRFSPSRLEMLGSCPQLYFFRHRLLLGEWEDPEAAHALDPREIGSAVHAVLAAVYARTDALSTGGHEALAAAVRSAWAEATERIAARLDPLYPGLWEPLGGAWREAIVRFVERDLPALLARGGTVECETDVDASVTLAGRAESLVLGGRFDRLLRAQNGVVVSDYKTGGDPGLFVRPLEFLKGRRLQMPLYALMAETGTVRGTGEPLGAGRADRVAVEVLGVGPRFERAPEEARAALDPGRFAQAREGILETLGVLVRLDDAGLYPLNESSDRCEWCVFRRACRRAHPATLERLAAKPELRDYALLRRKSTRAPLLAQAAALAGNGEEE
ncbi:MAG TPA: PD-(D/E)XK nuclease family protein [Candidatus Polarisedimenticolia bacterium]|nr:PD-(D/E)XK nuclease family protein [Candidatus Polarisedimenticolia bacterium]